MYSYCLLLVAAIFSIEKIGAQLSLYHRMITSPGLFKAYAKHPLGHDFLFGATRDGIYRLNVADDTYTLLTTLSSGKVYDIELVTSAAASDMLAIANRDIDCIQYMNLDSNFIQHLTGQCGLATFDVNKTLAEAKLNRPEQLGYDEQAEILYASIYESQYRLIACDIKQNWVKEIVADYVNILQLPSPYMFYFSSHSPYKLMIFDDVYNKIVTISLSLTLLAQEMHVMEDNVDVKGVANVGSVMVFFDNNDLMIGPDQPACLVTSSTCEPLGEYIKLLDKVSDYRLIAFTKDAHTIVVGVDEPNTTTVSHSTTTTSPTGVSHSSKPTHRSTVLFLNAKANGPTMKGEMRTRSVEQCSYWCIKSAGCQVFAYNDFTASCYLYDHLSTTTSSANTNTYRLTTL